MIGVKGAPIPPDCAINGAVPPSGRLCNGTSRQKAQQAVEYYNSHLVKNRGRVAYNRQVCWLILRSRGIERGAEKSLASYGELFTFIHKQG